MAKKKTLIALNSYISGGGKDTVADYLVEKHGFKKYALSKYIYEIAYNVFGIPFGTKPPRELLHHIGESLREYDAMVWIKKTLQDINEEGYDKVVITDVRKGLEHFYLKEMGYNNVMVYCDIETALERIAGRDGANANISMSMHNSVLESELRGVEMARIDNSGEIESTYEQVEKFLKETKQKY